MSLSLWLKVIAMAYYITNHFLIKVLNEKTLYKIWYKKKLDLFNLCVYDYNAYIIDYHIKFKRKLV